MEIDGNEIQFKPEQLDSHLDDAGEFINTIDPDGWGEKLINFGWKS